MAVINIDNEHAARIFKNLNFPDKTVIEATTDPETVDTVYGSIQKNIIENIGTPAGPSDTHVTKNYGVNGGDEWVIGGKLTTISDDNSEKAEKASVTSNDYIY